MIDYIIDWTTVKDLTFAEKDDLCEKMNEETSPLRIQCKQGKANHSIRVNHAPSKHAKTSISKVENSIC